METQAKRSSRVMMWIAGIAVALFCVAGVAAMLGWRPTSPARTADTGIGTGREPNSVMVPPAAPKVRSGGVPREHAPARIASTAPSRSTCFNCAVVESTRAVQSQGEGTGLGLVGGAVVGGLLGHQVGGGRGQEIATAVGAVGGAIGGNQIEKSIKSSTSYEIVIRFEDGSRRVIHQATEPTWRSGDRVKVVDGVIESNS